MNFCITMSCLLSYLLMFQDLKQSVNGKEDDIKQSIQTAEELVQTTKVDKKDESAQQLQKLKSSTADLRVRFDSVSSYNIHLNNAWLFGGEMFMG